MANYLDISTKSVNAGQGRLPKFRGHIYPTITVTTSARELYDYESGSIVFLTISGSADVAITLPAVSQAGLWFRFIATASPTGAGDAVITSAAGDDINYFEGPDSGADGSYTTASDTVTLEAAALGGEIIDFVSDGTNWYAYGRVGSDDATSTAG
tara:strand:- start:1292 stop:1756 length:465 start_codon:yes stop_codon:yes gene_type:complete